MEERRVTLNTVLLETIPTIAAGDRAYCRSRIPVFPVYGVGASAAG